MIFVIIIIIIVFYHRELKEGNATTDIAQIQRE